MRYDDRFRALCDSALKTRRYVGSLGFRTGRICLFSQRNEV
jgi:hypothetical protein